MPLLLAILALGFPRLVIVLLVIFSDWVGAAYQTVLWPLLGFLFMPYTTLAYALAINSQGRVDGVYLILVAVAVLFDLGAIGLGSRSGRRG